MGYKINNVDEIPDLLVEVKRYVLKYMEDSEILDDYDRFISAVSVVFEVFSNVMDLKTAFKLLDLLNYDLEDVGYMDTDKRLWWFLNALAWDANKEKLRKILNERYVAEEKEKISDLVTATVGNKEKKRI